MLYIDKTTPYTLYYVTCVYLNHSFNVLDTVAIRLLLVLGVVTIVCCVQSQLPLFNYLVTYAKTPERNKTSDTHSLDLKKVVTSVKVVIY